MENGIYNAEQCLELVEKGSPRIYTAVKQQLKASPDLASAVKQATDFSNVKGLKTKVLFVYDLPVNAVEQFDGAAARLEQASRALSGTLKRAGAATELRAVTREEAEWPTDRMIIGHAAEGAFLKKQL